MMGLVIEEVRERPAQLGLLRLTGHVAVAERAADRIVAEPADEAADAGIFGRARRPEIGEGVVEDLVQPFDAARHALEPAHPDAVADQDVIQGGVNRAEEGRPPGAVVLNTQRSAGLIEATIGPGVVAGEAMEIAAVHAGPASY